MAESFTFLLAAAIILYEQYRSRKQANRRKDYIDESLSTVQENQARINALAADIGTIKETLETMRETNVLIAEGLGRIVAAEKVSAMVNERLDRVLGLKELFGDDPTASQLVINIESGSNTAAGIRSEGDTQHLLDRLNIALGKTRKRGDDQEDRISEALSQVVG